MQRCLPSTQPLQAHYKGSEILLVRHQLRVVCSHLDTLVGYFSRRRPICSITEVTNLVSKEKGLVSTQPAGAIPWISSQKPSQAPCHCHHPPVSRKQLSPGGLGITPKLHKPLSPPT